MKNLVLVVTIILKGITTASEPTIELVSLGQKTLTAYRSVPGQTDDSPFHTSTNEHVRPGGVALSRDLLCGACRKLHRRCLHPDYKKKLHYNDWLYAKDLGFLRVNDVMGATQKSGKKRVKITQHIDVWVPTLADEKAFHKRFKGQTQEFWKVEERP